MNKCFFCRKLNGEHRAKCPHLQTPEEINAHERWIQWFLIGRGDIEGLERPDWADSFAVNAYNTGFDMRNHIDPWDYSSDRAYEKSL